MLSRQDLRKLARARLKDAATLLAGGRYDGAVYLSGYVVEMALKARICRHLKWQGYPATRKEFEDLQSFRTHDLNVLLRLSGIELRVTSTYLAEWSVVVTWNPEVRYKPIGSSSRRDAERIIAAANVLLGVIR